MGSMLNNAINMDILCSESIYSSEESNQKVRRSTLVALHRAGETVCGGINEKKGQKSAQKEGQRTRGSLGRALSTNNANNWKIGHTTTDP
jgi:hypothetical protein